MRVCKLESGLVGNIYCAGRNYLAHAAELGNAPAKDQPFFFLKPTSCLVFAPDAIVIPRGAELHHEVELAVVIKNRIDRPLLSEAEALGQILGYCTVIDVTARNWQDEAKAKRLPWTLAKGCRTFLPCSSEMVCFDDHDDKVGAAVDLELKVNGVTKQRASTASMIHSVPQLLMYLSRFHTLLPHDMVLTGTPSGVGPMLSGDVVEISAFGLSTRFTVESA